MSQKLSGQISTLILSFVPYIHMLSMYNVLTVFKQEAVVRVGVWCIGEYGDLLVNNIGMLDIEEPLSVSFLLHS